jgi:hypothetical protein
MMQNADYRLAAVYIQFAFDAERNGWMVIGTATLNDADGGATLAEYTLALDNAYRVAAINTHRDGYRVDITDLRLATSPLDYFGTVINTSTFGAALSPAVAVALPVGATDVTVLGAAATALAVSRTGTDGVIPVVTTKSPFAYGLAASALANGDVLSWERAEVSFNLGDVIVYDRRGNLGPFGTGGVYDPVPYPSTFATTGAVQDTYGWEEIYGTDYPYSWLVAGATKDAPVIQNGLCRVRYDNTGALGFRVDSWNPATSAFIEQGKITTMPTVIGAALSGTFDNTFLSAQVLEYTPERAVIELVTQNSATPSIRSSMLIILQRGWTGPRVEVYSPGQFPAILYSLPTGEANDGAMKIDGGIGSYAGQYLSSAVGSSTSPWVTGTQLGASGIPGENELAIVRQGIGQVSFAVMAPRLVTLSQRSAYTSPTNTLALFGATTLANYVANWNGVNLGFSLAAVQTFEAEAIRNTTNGTQVTDATASGGLSVSTAATTSLPALSGATAFLSGATYRLFVRAKIGTSGATANFSWLLAGTSSTATLTTTSTTWTWIDLGEVTAPSANPALTVNAYRSAGSGLVYLDRGELVMMTEGAGRGARDLGQLALYDQRTQTRKVTRG